MSSLILAYTPILTRASILIFNIFQGLRLYLGKIGMIIIFESLLTTFEESCIFRGSPDSSPKSNHQIELKTMI